MIKYIFQVCMTLFLVSSCRSENELNQMPETHIIDVSTDETPEVDVLLVLDNSCSMQTDWDFITYGLTQIPIELNYYNFDWKIGMISMDPGDGLFLEIDPQTPDPGWEMIGVLNTFRQEAGGIEEGFTSALTARITYPDWFRSGVVTLIFFVTDEKEQSNISGSDFNSAWTEPHIVASMVGPRELIEGYLGCADSAEEYHVASDIIFDICATERWSLVEQIVLQN